LDAPHVLIGMKGRSAVRSYAFAGNSRIIKAQNKVLNLVLDWQVTSREPGFGYVLDVDQWRAGLVGSEYFVSAVLSGIRGIGRRFTLRLEKIL
jgi:hypothetical protein